MPTFSPYDPTANQNSLISLIMAPYRARAEALRTGGEAQARAAQISGQSYANMGQSLGQIATGAFSDYGKAAEMKQAQEAKAQRDARIRAVLPGVFSGDMKPEALFEAAGPDDAIAILKGVQAFGELHAGQVKDARDTAGRLALGAKKLPPDMLEAWWPELRTAAIKGKLGTEDTIPAKPDERYLDAVIDMASGKATEAKQPDGFTLSPGQQRFDAAGKSIANVPKPEEPPKPVYRQSADKRMLEKVGEVPAGAQIVQEAQPPRITVNTGPGTGALTPEGVEYAATQYRVTGVMPPMGMGNSQGRAAIINEAAKQVKALRQTPAMTIQKQAAFKSDAAALNRMRTMSSSAEVFETKALAQADKVVELSAKVGRSKWPIVNSAILAGNVEVAGDPDATLLLNAALTFTAEYAKIIEGSTGSAQGSSDAARRATERLLNPKYNHGTVEKAVDLMKWEMDQTIRGYDAVIGQITERMGGGAQVPAGVPGPAEGTQMPIPGIPGGVAELRNGKWIRVK